MKLLSQKQFKDVEEEQVTLQPEEPEDMVTTYKRTFVHVRMLTRLCADICSGMHTIS